MAPASTRAFGPHAAAVPVDDAPHVGQADAGALELVGSCAAAGTRRTACARTACRSRRRCRARRRRFRRAVVRRVADFDRRRRGRAPLYFDGVRQQVRRTPGAAAPDRPRPSAAACTVQRDRAAVLTVGRLLSRASRDERRSSATRRRSSGARPMRENASRSSISRPIRLAASTIVRRVARPCSSRRPPARSLEQRREAGDVPQRRAQVVRDRVAERLELVVDRGRAPPRGARAQGPRWLLAPCTSAAAA